MRKGKSIIGKNVLSLADGTRLHTVKDVIIGADNTEIVALLVDEGGLLSSSLVVPIEEVQSFGKDAVVISDGSAVVPANKYPRVNSIIDRRERLIGKKVFTEGGDEQGSIGDMYFDEATGRILGFEVTGGVINNMTKGNSYLAVEEIVRTGPDVVYIRPEAVASLDSQVGGIQGAFQGAQQKVGAAKDSAGQQVSSAKPEDNLIGRRAGSDVEDDEGNILVAANQRIRAEHVETAKQRGKLQALTAAASAGSLQDAGAGASSAVGAAGDAAGSLWDQFTRKIQDMTDATGKRVDEQQTKKRLSDIEDAVGRPVTKVILDREDNVILNLGDIITHSGVQRAYDSGALDTLLGSVYKGQVDFVKEEMRAPEQVASTTAATIEQSTGGATVVDELEQKVQTAEQQREAQKDQAKVEAEEKRQQREQEREQRAGERDAEAQQRQTEFEEARASKDTAGSTDPDATVTMARPTSRPSEQG